MTRRSIDVVTCIYVESKS